MRRQSGAAQNTNRDMVVLARPRRAGTLRPLVDVLSPPTLALGAVLLSASSALAQEAASQEPNTQVKRIQASPTSPSSGQNGPPSGEWSFHTNGYFRAPLRIGVGESGGPAQREEAIRRTGADVNPEGEVMVHDADGNWTGETQPQKTALHNPVLLDDRYAHWAYTGHNRRDWAELFFTVSNGTVSGTLALQGYQFTDAAWQDGRAQFGIGQGWVEIDHDLGFENVRFNLKVGSFRSHYGVSGRYDSGAYDTYLFARTHTMGGTGRLDLNLSAITLGLEGGFGANQPNPNMLNRARFTTLAHGHAFLAWKGIELGLHALHSWSAQEVVPTYPQLLPGSGGCQIDRRVNDTVQPGVPGAQCTLADGVPSNDPNVDGIAPGVRRTDGDEFAGGVGGIEGNRSVWGPEYPHGSQTVIGAELRVTAPHFGHLFLGYSYQFLNNALVVGNAIESIHSFGAGDFDHGVVDGYLESPFCDAVVHLPTDSPVSTDSFVAPNSSCSNGNGGIGSLLLQYDARATEFTGMPRGMDIEGSVYGMFNHIQVDALELERLTAIYSPRGVSDETIEMMRQDGVVKWKLGADVEFLPLELLGIGLRFDRLNPTNNKLLKQQGFSVLSPRITLRTKKISREEITLQYSRYFYDQRECVDEHPDGSARAVASPADDPYRGGGGDSPTGSIFGGTNSSTGLPLNLYCAPLDATRPSQFGQDTALQSPGTRGTPSLVPDENVIKLEASIWW